MESSTKTSRPTSIAQPASTIASVEDMTRDGVPLDGLEPWRYFPLLSPERVIRAFSTGGLRDSMDWIEFSKELKAGLYFESTVGWIAVQKLIQNCSAEIHGGAFAGRRAMPAEDIDPATHRLLDAICEWFNLPVLLSAYPLRNKAAAAWDARFGFERTGVIPLADIWGGKPDSLVVTARYRGGNDKGAA